MHSSLSPILRLLLLCCHRNLSLQQFNEANKLIADGIDAYSLAGLAQKHGLSMLLYRGLVQLRHETLTELTDTLEQTATTVAVEYELVYPQQIAEVISALNDSNIPSILLKGVVLGQETYLQPALRPYRDIDILVWEHDLDAAEQVIVKLGYRANESQHPASWYRGHHHHLVPYTRPDALTVEIHRGLVELYNAVPSNIQVEMLWTHAQPVRIANVNARMLCPEHQLIHLCIHAVGIHLFEMGLLHLCDIYETLTQYGSQLNWQLVIDHSEVWECRRQVTLALGVVRSLFDVEVPADVLHASDLPEGTIAYCLANVLHTAIQGLPQSSGLAQLWVEQGGSNRCRQIARRLFPSSTEIARRYGPWANSVLRWIYYPRWQLDMLRKHFRSVRKLLAADPRTLEQARHEAARSQLLAWLNEREQ